MSVHSNRDRVVGLESPPAQPRAPTSPSCHPEVISSRVQWGSARRWAPFKAKHKRKLGDALSSRHPRVTRSCPAPSAKCSTAPPECPAIRGRLVGTSLGWGQRGGPLWGLRGSWTCWASCRQREWGGSANSPRTAPTLAQGKGNPGSVALHHALNPTPLLVLLSVLLGRVLGVLCWLGVHPFTGTGDIQPLLFLLLLLLPICVLLLLWGGRGLWGWSGGHRHSTHQTSPQCGMWGWGHQDPTTGILGGLSAPLTQQSLPVLDENLGRGHHLFIRAVLPHRVDGHPDARGLGMDILRSPSPGGSAGMSATIPPGSPGPSHLQQLDGHGVTGERLEQVQSPFLRQGKEHKTHRGPTIKVETPKGCLE